MSYQQHNPSGMPAWGPQNPVQPAQYPGQQPGQQPLYPGYPGFFPGQQPKKPKTGLIIGLVAAGVLVVGGIVALILVLIKDDGDSVPDDVRSASEDVVAKINSADFNGAKALICPLHNNEKLQEEKYLQETIQAKPQLTLEEIKFVSKNDDPKLPLTTYSVVTSGTANGKPVKAVFVVAQSATNVCLLSLGENKP